MQEITRIGPVSAGRISAVIGAVFGLVAGLLLSLASTAIAVVVHLGAWLVQIAGATLICAIGGFVGGVIYAAIYNLVADRVGGIQIELSDA